MGESVFHIGSSSQLLKLSCLALFYYYYFYIPFDTHLRPRTPIPSSNSCTMPATRFLLRRGHGGGGAANARLLQASAPNQQQRGFVTGVAAVTSADASPLLGVRPFPGRSAIKVQFPCVRPHSSSQQHPRSYLHKSNPNCVTLCTISSRCQPHIASHL